MDGGDAIEMKMGSREKLAALVNVQKEGGREEGADDTGTASASGTQAPGHKKINTGMGVFINCGGMYFRSPRPCACVQGSFPEDDGYIYIYIYIFPGIQTPHVSASES